MPSAIDDIEDRALEAALIDDLAVLDLNDLVGGTVGRIHHNRVVTDVFASFMVKNHDAEIQKEMVIFQFGDVADEGGMHWIARFPSPFVATLTVRFSSSMSRMTMRE